MAWLLVSLIHLVNRDRLELEAKQQMLVHVLDLRCVSRTLHISVDEPVRRLALEHLAAMTLDDSNPIQVAAGWFDTLLNCVKGTNGSVSIIQGLEELTATSSLFCLRMLSHLLVMDPMPEILEDIHQRYTRTIPSETSFGDPLVPCFLGAVHRVFYQNYIGGRIFPFLTGAQVGRGSNGMTMNHPVMSVSNLHALSGRLHGSNTKGVGVQNCPDGSSALHFILYLRIPYPQPLLSLIPYQLS